MKKLVFLFTVLAIVAASASAASAQTIKPRRAPVAAPATAPALAPTPVATPAAEPATPAATVVTPAPVVAEPATAEPQEVAPPPPAELDLKQKVGHSTTGDLLEMIPQAANNATWGYEEIQVLRVRTERANQKLNWILLGFAGLLSFFIGRILGGSLWDWFKSRKKTATKIAPTFILFALGLGLASTVEASQAPAPAAKAADTCTIRAITVKDGGVVVKEQDPTAISITVRNCTEVKSVSVATGATDIVFTDVAQKGNVVTAKVAATATALTGPTAIKVVLEDGTEVESPDSTYVLVLDLATAVVRKDTVATAATLRKEVAVASKALKALEERVNTRFVHAGTATAEAEAKAAAATAKATALGTRVDELEALLKATAAAANTNAENITVLADGQAKLARMTATLAGTKVKKSGFLGFGGMKPLDPAIALAAAEIEAVAAAMIKK